MTHIEYKHKMWVKDNKNGYYHAHFGKTTKLLHRQIWEDNYGPIPKGYHIHHIDENKDNNDIKNLELISASEHLRNHALRNIHNGVLNTEKNLKRAREEAKKWHHSLDGIEWHKQHAKIISMNMKYVENTCILCGKKYMVKKAYSKKSKFCSNVCKSAYRRHNGADDISCICVICGNKFIKNKYNKSKTCSLKCRGILNHENKKDSKSR